MTPPINSEGVFNPGHVPRAPSVPRFNARDDAARLRAIALELASPVADAVNEVATRMEDGAYAERVMVLGRDSDIANDAAKLRAAATRMSYGNTHGEAKQKHILNETAIRIETGAYGSALDVQEGGAHYKGKAIQPVEYIVANNLPFIEGSVVKYITRWREKGGVEDLKKIKHYIDLLIELDAKYGALPTGV